MIQKGSIVHISHYHPVVNGWCGVVLDVRNGYCYVRVMRNILGFLSHYTTEISNHCMEEVHD